MADLYLTPEKRKNFIDLFVHYDYYGIGYIHYTCVEDIFASMHIPISEDDALKLLVEVGN